ncbi:hypothetical protein ONA70_09045 [Micromonospora yasonensis]|uniref:LppU/SCO3897 family protein n=1 Tax=Micromonospora yasonensis TaxID=1128667 RepID=UPI0022306DC5|nr:hypothetical protein [Micromonospora yasonensis]MCW3840241.1 hypothetical protein [Micromonospora yasonensis]
MTSEAPHRPGQEPGEVSPGAGGPAPYGDRPTQQDNGYSGAPDLGWAPPPPAGRPAQPAPAWAAQDDQPPAWAPQGGQPTNRGSAQVPASAEPGAWGGAAQPAWAAPEQNPPAWATPAAPSGESAPPAWGAPAAQDAPAWAAAPAPQGEQPAWAQAGESAARGSAQVPAPATTPHEAWATPAGHQQDDPSRSGGWNAPDPQQDDNPGHAGDWPAAAPPPDRSGGWSMGAAAQQHDDPNRSGGWSASQQDEQPAWGAAPAEPTDRAAAKVPVPGQGDNAWTTPDDPARSGGWDAGAHDGSARSGGWEADPAGPRDEDPDGSGGWAAGRAADASQPAWGTSDEQRPAWGEAAAGPQDEPAQPGWAGAPTSGDGPAASARASAAVPAPDTPPAWGGNQDNPAQWTPQRQAIPDAEPWAPGAAWGQAAETEPAESPSNGWEPNRAEEAPLYQAAPGPGISPANAVPLPPQEHRVPGAALAASPPADYAPSGQFGPAAESADPQGYEPERAAWGAPGPSHEEPQSPAGPAVPAPRISPESGAVSASASVPMASRAAPPLDQPLHETGAPAPQPRVYGRPIRPEAEEGPGQDAPNGFPEQGPRFDEHGPYSRMDEPERPNGFAEVPPVPSAPPSSPAGPPPFPPGVPSFMDPVGNNRPANGVHPHSDEPAGDPFGAPGDPFGGPGGQRDPFGGPGPFAGAGTQHDQFGGPGGQHDPFGGPGGQHDPFGGPGGHPDPFGGPGGHPDPFGGPGAQHDPFGGPGAQHDPFGGPPGGRAAVAGPRQGPGEPGPGGFPPAFPPPPQQAPPPWQQGPGGDPDQGRFDAFKPEAEPKTEAPTPKVRNGRVLAAVLVAAVAILAIPLGLLALLGKLGGDDGKPQPFNPAVGSCIKQSGETAAPADCGEPGAFTVVSRVDNKDKCADPTQPTVTLKNESNPVLCLKPAGK